MWKNDNQLYIECLEARALDYIENYDGKPVILYLEFSAGPVMAAFITKYGIQKVNDDLELKISEQKS